MSILQDCSDEELMTSLVRGRQQAFNELYRRHARRMYHYFLRMLNRDEEKAGDFLQDLFLKIAEKPQRFDADKRFSTWLFSVAYNMCKNEYRRMNVRRNMEAGHDLDAMPCAAVASDGFVEQRQFMDALDRELHGLDEQQRTCFLLRYKEQFSIREISEILDCPEGTVKSRLHYTIRRLSGALEEFRPI